MLLCLSALSYTEPPLPLRSPDKVLKIMEKLGHFMTSNLLHRPAFVWVCFVQGWTHKTRATLFNCVQIWSHCKMLSGELLITWRRKLIWMPKLVEVANIKRIVVLVHVLPPLSPPTNITINYYHHPILNIYLLIIITLNPITIITIITIMTITIIIIITITIIIAKKVFQSGSKGSGFPFDLLPLLIAAALTFNFHHIFFFFFRLFSFSLFSFSFLILSLHPPFSSLNHFDFDMFSFFFTNGLLSNWFVRESKPS